MVADGEWLGGIEHLHAVTHTVPVAQTDFDGRARVHLSVGELDNLTRQVHQLLLRLGLSTFLVGIAMTLHDVLACL